MLTEAYPIAYFAAYLLITTVLVAAVIDICTHRIPNNLLSPVLAVALIMATSAGGTMGLLTALGGLWVGLLMLLPLYFLGAMGAGDVKLLGVAGAFLGPQGVIMAGVTTFVAGAVIGCAWLAWKATRPVVEHWFMRAMEARNGALPRTLMSAPADQSTSFAYAPAIATGVAFAVWQQGWQVPTMMG